MIKVGGDQSRLHGYWQDILDSGHFTEGKYVRLLEDAVSDFYGMTALAVNSAGTGLYTILRGLDLDNSSRGIIVPNNTFYCTGAMAQEVSRDVVLVDADRGDFSMSFAALEALPWTGHFGPPQAIILTHVGGGLSRHYERISGWAKGRGIHLIEDAAHALGVKQLNGITAGALSKAAVFSLYPTKAIPSGEGGIIVTSDEALAERCSLFRNYGKFRDREGVLRHSPFGGFNFRMDEWTAAVAWHQWQRLSEIMEKREEAAERLSKVVEPMVDWDCRGTNWYKYIVSADFQSKRKTGQVYAETDQLLHCIGGSRGGSMPNSEWIANNHICLPLDEDLYTGMTPGEIEAWLMGADNNPNVRT